MAFHHSLKARNLQRVGEVKKKKTRKEEGKGIEAGKE